MTLKNALSEDFEDFWETWELGAPTEKQNPQKKIMAIMFPETLQSHQVI